MLTEHRFDHRESDQHVRIFGVALELLTAVALGDAKGLRRATLIDNTPKALARVPERFRERQWSQLEGGAASPEFISQVQRLLSTLPGPATALESWPPVPTRLKPVRGLFLRSSRHCALWPLRQGCTGAQGDSK
jgi:hypothetical protein